jgi:hypothetical protein
LTSWLVARAREAGEQLLHTLNDLFFWNHKATKILPPLSRTLKPFQEFLVHLTNNGPCWLMCSQPLVTGSYLAALLLLHISDFWPWLVMLFALMPILKLYNLVPNANAAIVGKQFVNIKAVATQCIRNLRTTLKERGIREFLGAARVYVRSSE